MTSIARRYAQLANCYGSCPIEAGTALNLADHECRHGRLPGDPTRRCGCWAEEGPVLFVIQGEKSMSVPVPAARFVPVRLAVALMLLLRYPEAA